ncbi:hypothetical protein ABZP36_004299 [Zizania latifolia]
MAPAAVAVLVLSVAGLGLAVAAAPPPPRGQQVHLFRVVVQVPSGRVVDPDEYNYWLLATVLGRSSGGGVSSANGWMMFLYRTATDTSKLQEYLYRPAISVAIT